MYSPMIKIPDLSAAELRTGSLGVFAKQLTFLWNGRKLVALISSLLREPTQGTAAPQIVRWYPVWNNRRTGGASEMVCS